MKKWIRGIGSMLAWPAVVLGAIWTAGALAFDLPWPALRTPAAIAFGIAMILALRFSRGKACKLAIPAVATAAVAAWWLTLRPSHDREWQPDVARLARAEIDGDVVTLHNVRNFDYRSATDFTERWESRTVNLAHLTGADIAINYWGSPWMAHPIVSFQFADAPPVCFSIETRKEVGEAYSAIGGFYRRFELIYIVADERDVLRVRTSIRDGEDVYLYRTTMTPAQARRKFLEYIRTANHIHDHPRWYNALTTNCTTAIRAQTPADRRAPWDWRLLVNGKGDEMMYDCGQIVTAGLPFPELKRQAHANPAALAAGRSPDFSRLIRINRPGFGNAP